MIYTAMTKTAMRIAYNAHKDQVDKTGMPYIFHPFHLAEQMRDEALVCAALLHDVVEDTALTFDDLRQAGISDEVIVALALLTHADEVPYLQYVQHIKDSGNPIAIAVKLADLQHNADPTRLDEMDDSMLARCKKYQEAIALLRR